MRASLDTKSPILQAGRGISGVLSCVGGSGRPKLFEVCDQSRVLCQRVKRAVNVGCVCLPFRAFGVLVPSFVAVAWMYFGCMVRVVYSFRCLVRCTLLEGMVYRRVYGS